MSIFETTITNPKKQLKFYKQLSEQLRQENTNLRIEISAREEEYRKLERTIQGLILFAWQSEMNESEYNRFCAIAGGGVNNE